MTTHRTRTVAQKMGVRAGARAHRRHAPASAVDAMALPDLDVAPVSTAAPDHAHLFALTQEQLRSEFAALRDAVRPTGMLGVSA